VSKDAAAGALVSDVKERFSLILLVFWGWFVEQGVGILFGGGAEGVFGWAWGKQG